MLVILVLVRKRDDFFAWYQSPLVRPRVAPKNGVRVHTLRRLEFRDGVP